MAADCDAGEVAIRRARGILDRAQTDPAVAQVDAEALLDESSDPEVQATARYALGMALRTQHHLNEARETLRRAAEEAFEAGLETLGGRALLSLSGCEYMAGRYDDAIGSAGEAAGHLTGPDLAACKVQTATFLTAQDRNREALAMFDEAIDELIAEKAMERLPLVYTNRGLTLVDLGRLTEAQHDLEKAWELVEHDPAQIGFVLSHLGWVAALRGDLVMALRWFERLDVPGTPGRNDPGWLVDYSYALLESGLTTEAIEMARRSLDSATEKGLKARRLVPLQVLAEGSIRVGDFTTAIAAASSAVEAMEELGTTPLPARILECEAYLARSPTIGDLDRFEGVIRDLEKTDRAGLAASARVDLALACARLGLVERALNSLPTGAFSSGQLRTQARAWTALALVRLAGGNRRGAESALRAALRRADLHRQAFGDAELRASSSGLGEDAAQVGLQIAQQSRIPAKVLAWAELTRSAAHRMPRLRGNTDPQKAKLQGEYRQAFDKLRKGAGDARNLERELSRLERRIRDRARTAVGGNQQGRKDVPSISDVRGRLEGGVFVEFVATEDGAHALIVGPTRSHLVEIPGGTDITHQLWALDLAVGRLLAGSTSPSSLGKLDRVLSDLDDRLVGPWRHLLRDHAVISPVGRLHAIPWSALPSLRYRPMSVLPSASALLRERPIGRAQPVLAAGPDLANAGGEIDAIKGAWPGASVLTGKAATVEKVLGALDGASIAHLVAHGRFRTDNPMFTSLMLADGPLNLYDLEELQAPPEVVVLSACEVGSSVVQIGNELLGMAAAFLEMGSRAVVAPLFPVSDRATRSIMEVVHGELASGSTPAQALAAARQTEDPEERLAAASFLCFG